MQSADPIAATPSDEAVLSRIRQMLQAGLAVRPHPQFSAAVAQVALRGRTLAPVTIGDLEAWLDPDTPVPQADRVPVRADTTFDIASLTKLVTGIVALQVFAANGIRLDDAAGEVLPSYRARERSRVTWRHLLTHSSGLPPTADVWRVDAPPAERVQLILDEPLVAPAGTVQAYSCVGYITTGLALSAITGTSLDVLVADLVCRPLGLGATTYLPAGSTRGRCAATEFVSEPPRGMVRGEVHDETAWSLGGVSGNAGLFSTAGDMLRLGLALCGSGETRLLDEAQARLVQTDQLPPGVPAEYGQAIGARIGDPASTRDLPTWLGHTGFTGTSMVANPSSGTVAVLLTNRVHPRREWSDIGDLRRGLAALVSAASD